MCQQFYNFIPWVKMMFRSNANTIQQWKTINVAIGKKGVWNKLWVRRGIQLNGINCVHWRPECRVSLMVFFLLFKLASYPVPLKEMFNVSFTSVRPFCTFDAEVFQKYNTAFHLNSKERYVFMYITLHSFFRCFDFYSPSAPWCSSITG